MSNTHSTKEDFYRMESEAYKTHATVWEARARQAEEEVKELERQLKAVGNGLKECKRLATFLEIILGIGSVIALFSVIF